jgi:hypothetical protein
MKKSLFFQLFLFSATLLLGQTETKKGRIEVAFTWKTTFNDLVKAKLDMAEKGITLNYQRLVFWETGNLREIAFTVDCHDGFSGGANTLQASNTEPIGFFRDYDDKSTPFGTGDMTKR